jgi:hypothetical protein
MPFESDKIMFEVYKEATYSGRYRVVYFTELLEHNKESEINRAMAGEHFFDGFIWAYRKDQAKEAIARLLARLNEGETISKADFEREIEPFVAGRAQSSRA